MTTRHIPIVIMNTNRGLSLSDIRPLASSSSSLTTASSSCNLQQHTVNVNPTVTTNSTNIDGITYPPSFSFPILSKLVLYFGLKNNGNFKLFIFFLLKPKN